MNSCPPCDRTARCLWHWRVPQRSYLFFFVAAKRKWNVQTLPWPRPVPVTRLIHHYLMPVATAAAAHVPIALVSAPAQPGHAKERNLQISNVDFSRSELISRDLCQHYFFCSFKCYSISSIVYYISDALAAFPALRCLQLLSIAYIFIDSSRLIISL